MVDTQGAALIDKEPPAQIPLTSFAVGERPKATLQQVSGIHCSLTHSYRR